MKRKLLAYFFTIVCFMIPSFSFAEPQEFPFNEDVDEEIIIVNNASTEDAFKISIRVPEGFYLNVDISSFKYLELDNAGYFYLTKSDLIKPNDKWKSTSDYELMEHADKIRIETKSGNKYSYTFRNKHDKLYIYVKDFEEGDDW